MPTKKSEKKKKEEEKKRQEEENYASLLEKVSELFIDGEKKELTIKGFIVDDEYEEKKYALANGVFVYDASDKEQVEDVAVKMAGLVHENSQQQQKLKMYGFEVKFKAPIGVDGVANATEDYGPYTTSLPKKGKKKLQLEAYLRERDSMVREERELIDNLLLYDRESTSDEEEAEKEEEPMGAKTNKKKKK